MNRQYTFHVKSVSETGEFTGVTAVYDNVDLGGDRIKPGAFTKTIKESGGRLPLLADHRIPIGAAFLTDSNEGLVVKGKLNLDKEVARDTHSDLKFYADNQIPYGMSFGYDVVKSERQGEVRELTELKVYESSTTLFPMNPAARVLAVKQREDLESLVVELKGVKDLLAAAKPPVLSEEEQFIESLDFIKTILAPNEKVGRRFSGASKETIETVRSLLAALIQEAAAEDDTSKSAAQPSIDEPVFDHSQLEEQFKNSFQGVIKSHGFPTTQPRN